MKITKGSKEEGYIVLGEELSEDTFDRYGIAFSLPASIEITVRFDGCIHFVVREEEGCSTEGYTYMHICDIDSTIRLFKKIKTIAKSIFGEDW